MTRKKLSQVYFLDKEIKMRERQLAELVQRSQVKSPQITGMPFQNTGEVSDKVMETAIKIITFQEQLEAYKDALQIEKESIERWAMSLDDSYLRQIVHYRCYELMSWTKIARMLNTTEGSVKMYYNRSIPKE